MGLAGGGGDGYTLEAVESMKGEKEGAAPVSGLRPSGRLPYEKPSVSWEQPLEAQPSLMSGCQKTPGGGPDCTSVGPISS